MLRRGLDTLLEVREAVILVALSASIVSLVLDAAVLVEDIGLPFELPLRSVLADWSTWNFQLSLLPHILPRYRPPAVLREPRSGSPVEVESHAEPLSWTWTQ